MRLVLHIGIEKTGTTALQEWLYANRREFLSQGILLPSSLSQPNNKTIVHCFQDEVDQFFSENGFTDKLKREKFCGEILRDFCTEIEQSPGCYVVIITSEHFHSRLTKIKEIDSFISWARDIFDDIVVVGYLRNQAQLCVSKYSTAVRGRRDESIDEYLMTNTEMSEYYDMYEFVQKWLAAADGSCVFRSYDDIRKADADIRLDFIKAANIEIDPTRLDMRIVTRNTAVSALEAAVLRRVNKLIPYHLPSGRVNRVNKIAKKIALSLCRLIELIIPRKPVRPTSEAVEQVRAKFSASNEALFRVFGVDIR